MGASESIKRKNLLPGGRELIFAHPEEFKNAYKEIQANGNKELI